jgi:hypothetical protein
MSKYYLRSKKGQWIWIYDFETKRKKRIQLQSIIDNLNCGSVNKKYFVIRSERDQQIERLK